MARFGPRVAVALRAFRQDVSYAVRACELARGAADRLATYGASVLVLALVVAS